MKHSALNWQLSCNELEGNTLYILNEPTTGLHLSDVEKLVVQLNHLVEAGNTVIVIKHDIQVIA